MQQDHELCVPAVRLRPGGVPGERPSAVEVRDRGIRRLRHVSNWTLAALLVGVGASSAALARAVPAASGPPAISPATGPVAGSVASVGASSSARAPSVSQPVATSSGSTVAAAPSPGAPGVNPPAPSAAVGTTGTGGGS